MQVSQVAGQIRGISLGRRLFGLAAVVFVVTYSFMIVGLIKGIDAYMWVGLVGFLVSLGILIIRSLIQGKQC
jgi:hypothetical protein